MATPFFLSWFAKSPFTTLCHGDPRIENWYFPITKGEGDTEAGLFDWQQVMNGPSYTDVCWFLTQR